MSERNESMGANLAASPTADSTRFPFLPSLHMSVLELIEALPPLDDVAPLSPARLAELEEEFYSIHLGPRVLEAGMVVTCPLTFGKKRSENKSVPSAKEAEKFRP